MWISRRLVIAVTASTLAVLVGACGAAEDLLTYEFDTESEITVPGRGFGIVDNPLAPDEVFPIDFETAFAEQLQQSFETNDINKDAVDSLKVTGLSLVVQNPDEANGNALNGLDFLESLRFDMASTDSNKTEVAASADGAFDEPIFEYDFPVTENELVEVLKGGDSMTMETELETEPGEEGRPRTDADLLFTVTVTVIANPAGAAAGGL